MKIKMSQPITKDHRAILAGLTEPMTYLDLYAKFKQEDGSYRYSKQRILGVLKALAERGLADFKPKPANVKGARGLWRCNDAGSRVLAKYEKYTSTS